PSAEPVTPPPAPPVSAAALGASSAPGTVDSGPTTVGSASQPSVSSTTVASTSSASGPGSVASAPATVASAVPTPAATQTPAARSAAAKPDDRVAQFVEAIRVTGIRSSGSESRVLMNERVYRVNEVVERNLGVKLVKVAPDTLTFSDTNGITYEKHF